MLFDPKLTKPVEAQGAQVHQVSNLDAIGYFDNLKNALPQIKPDSIYHWVSPGKWSLHELILYLLTFTGKAHIHMSTWSMTEDPVRQLLQAKKRGDILSIKCVLSERISERTPHVMQLAENVFDELVKIKLHAKVLVMEGEKMSLVSIGSANLTRNPRTECGVIDTHMDSINFHKQWLVNELIT